MRTERIKLFALLLAALLMIAMLPVTAFADSSSEDETEPIWNPDFYLQSYSVSGTSSSRTTVRPGNTFKLTLTFHVDPDEVNVNNISLILDDGNFKESSGKVVYEVPSPSESSDTIKTLTVVLSLKADSNLSTGTYQFPFSARLKSAEGAESMTIDFSSVYISVNKPVIGDDDESDDDDDTDPILTPHLVISSVSTAGQQLPKDENFTVTINFTNTGKSAALEGVMMSLTPEAGITLPKASTNFYIEKIKAGETVSETFTLYADGDTVKTAFASLGVAFSYQYLANDAYASGTDTESVSLFFGDADDEDEDEDRFDILNIETPDSLYPGEEGYLTFTIINKGSAPICNIMGKVESEALSNNGASEYFGQLAANTKDELELPLVAAAGGEIIGTATITYELEDGTEKTIVRDFTAYAEEAAVDDPGEMYPTEPIVDETAGPNLLWAYIGGGVVVAAILTTVLVKRAKKKKAAALADDDI